MVEVIALCSQGFACREEHASDTLLLQYTIRKPSHMLSHQDILLIRLSDLVTFWFTTYNLVFTCAHRDEFACTHPRNNGRFTILVAVHDDAASQLCRNCGCFRDEAACGQARTNGGPEVLAAVLDESAAAAVDGFSPAEAASTQLAVALTTVVEVHADSQVCVCVYVCACTPGVCVLPRSQVGKGLQCATPMRLLCTEILLEQEGGQFTCGSWQFPCCQK